MNCVICGKELKGKRSDAKFCSQACLVQNALNVRAARKGLDRIIRPLICPICNKEYLPNRHAYKNQIYCSEKCCIKAMNKRAIESGRKSINAKTYNTKHREQKIQHDKAYTNARHFNGLREIVLKRDGYKCVLCGNEKGLVIHHKDETGISDVKNTDLINNNPDNLETVCRSCHIKLHQEIPQNYKAITKEQIEEVLTRVEKVEDAAKLLGITRKTLLLKRKQYGLSMREPRKFTKKPKIY